jgi:hypothetical protein
MTKPEEKQVDTTGSFTLTCLECEFKETIWGSPGDDNTNTEALDACKAHCKRFKHKKILITISSFWFAEYDEANDTMNSQPAPKNKLFKLNR